MSRFAVHTPETAPEASRFALAGAQSKFGFVPNLIGMLADSPAAVGGYLGIGEQFDRSSFTPAERQVVLLAVSFENGCDYCMAAHTVVAGMSKVPALAIEALRTGEPLPDPVSRLWRASPAPWCASAAACWSPTLPPFSPRASPTPRFSRSCSASP